MISALEMTIDLDKSRRTFWKTSSGLREKYYGKSLIATENWKNLTSYSVLCLWMALTPTPFKCIQGSQNESDVLFKLYWFVSSWALCLGCSLAAATLLSKMLLNNLCGTDDFRYQQNDQGCAFCVVGRATGSLNVWLRQGTGIFSTWLALCEGNPSVTGGFPSQRASNEELSCFLLCMPDQTVERTVQLLVISDAMPLMRR